MHLRFRNKLGTDPILHDIGDLLNHAQFCAKDAFFNQNENSFFLKINRFQIIKKTFFSKTKHSTEVIQCDVIIRNVEEWNIKNNAEEIDKFTILFGLHFEKGHIYFCSVEEDKGNPCYSFDCKVSEIDIEIIDR